MISIRREIINPTKKKTRNFFKGIMHMIDLFVRQEKIMSHIMMPIVTNSISKRK